MRWFDDLSGQAAYRQYSAPNVIETSSTSILVTIDDSGMLDIPNSYTFIIQRMNKVNDFSGNYPVQTFTSSTKQKEITGLVAKGLYLIKTRASGPIGNGSTVQRYFQLEGTEKSPAKSSSVGGTSFFQIIGGTSTDSKYSLAVKDFGAIQIPTQNTMSISYGNDRTAGGFPAYNTGPFYYSFGTSFIFPPLDYASPQEAGLGFFVNSDQSAGYYIMVATSGTAAAATKDPVRIIKVVGKQIKVLKTSQKNDATRLDTVYGGETHTIDVKVKIGGTSSSDPERGKITINAFVDGFKITATDQNFASTSKPRNDILPITKKVGLVVASGTASFDYVYGSSIDATAYDTQDRYNTYLGKFSNDYLLTQYGDLAYVEGNADDDTDEFEDSYEEFGTTAREIVKREASFNGPAFPNNWNLGYNQNISILDQSISNFDAKIFILNNTSQPTVLSDQELNVLEIQGTSIAPAGEVVYTTGPDSKFAVNEPISFESNWIQNEEDAKKLAEFIQSHVVSKSKIISMTIFGNPLLSVGDIVTVNYPYQGMNQNEDIIITSIFQDYSEGLATSITGRTIRLD